MTLVTAGRVGRAHGLDGSFYVDAPSHPLVVGTVVRLDGDARRVERRGGSDRRPLIRLAGVTDARPHHGGPLLVEQELGADEWLASELEECEVLGRGRVSRVIDGPSCDVLELEDGSLVPFVSDAIRAVDRAGRRIEVNEQFLAGQ